MARVRRSFIQFAPHGRPSQAVEELHQIWVIPPFRVWLAGAAARIAHCEGFGFGRQIGFSVNISGIHRKMTEPSSNGVDVHASTKQM